MSSAKWRPFCLGLNVLRSFTDVGIGQNFLIICGYCWYADGGLNSGRKKIIHVKIFIHTAMNYSKSVLISLKTRRKMYQMLLQL